MVILTISHNIFLTKEQRYILVKKDSTIDVIGVSLPVWIRKGMMPLPAQEIFCKYTLMHNGKPPDIIPNSNGYTINIPTYKDQGWRTRVTNDTWRKMSEETKAKWYEKHSGPHVMQLLDIQDGGSDGHLSFIINSTIHKIDTFHFIEIKPVEALLQSMI